MFRTEEEARKCWCPFALGSETFDWDDFMGVTATNRITYGIHSKCKCIASECMAWRWVIDDGMINEAGHGRTSAPEYGYCGLAGKPEA